MLQTLSYNSMKTFLPILCYYGIIVSVDNQNLVFNLMTKMTEKKVPYDLIIQILAQRKTDIKIIQEYISKVK